MQTPYRDAEEALQTLEHLHGHEGLSGSLVGDEEVELVEKEGAVVVAAQVLRERAEQRVDLARDKEHVLHALHTIRGVGDEGGEHEDQEEEVAQRGELPRDGVEGGQEGDHRLADVVKNRAELTGVA